MVTKDHLKDVLAGKKKLMKRSELKTCSPPAFDEIGVKALYDKIILLDGMNDYFPAKFPKGSQCDREYMYNIWNTLYPEDVTEVINYANSLRYSIDTEKEKDNNILITDEWEKELNSLPFKSKQKGRMSLLLKVKSKLIAEKKDRVTYPAFDF